MPGILWNIGESDLNASTWQALFGDDDDADFWENLESQGDSLPLEDSQPKEESETKKRERSTLRQILRKEVKDTKDTPQAANMPVFLAALWKSWCPFLRSVLFKESEERYGM